MITNFKTVKPGTNGGISFLGEQSAILGAAIIALFIIFIDVNPLMAFIAAVLGGFIGTNFDSLLGATLEKKGILTNDTVNLLATLIGGQIAIFAYMLFV